MYTIAAAKLSTVKMSYAIIDIRYNYSAAKTNYGNFPSQKIFHTKNNSGQKSHGKYHQEKNLLGEIS